MLAVSSYTVEAHAYATTEEMDPEVSYSTYSDIVSKSPFSAGTRAREAYEYLRAQGNQVPLIEFYTCRLMWLLSVFMGVRYIASKATKFAIIRIINAAYTVVFGVPRAWWAISSSIGTLAFGRSDPVVAGIIPKDPFALSKATSLFIHALLPKTYWLVLRGME